MSTTVLETGYEALHTTMSFPPVARYNHMLRMRAVALRLRGHEIGPVMDMGCGDGRFIMDCLKKGLNGPFYGIDNWGERLRIGQDKFDEKGFADRVKFIDGSMTDVSSAMPNVDDFKKSGAVVLLETIEHVPLSEVPNITDGVFGYVNPKLIVITTPDATKRLRDEQLEARGHHFEWDIPEFRDWAESVAAQYPEYNLAIDQLTGPTFYRNTQIATFVRE